MGQNPPGWVHGNTEKGAPVQPKLLVFSLKVDHTSGWLGEGKGHSSIPPASGGLGGQVLVNLLGPAIRGQPVGYSVYTRLSNRLASWGTDFYPHSQTSHISGILRGKVIC